MEVISYLNIEVAGFAFQKLETLTIQHKPNQHAVAEVVGEIASDKAADMVKRIDEMALVKITTTAEGQEGTLFCGCVNGITLEQANDYSRIRLSLCSTSRLLDSTHINRSYQNTKKSYNQILSENIAAVGDLHMMVTDKQIGTLIMQYKETDWEFIKRMASRLQAPVIANLQSERPQIYIGLPPSSGEVPIDTTSYSYGNDNESQAKDAGSMPQDYSEEQVQSYQYAYIGGLVTFNGNERCIKSVYAYLKDGILQMQYGLLHAEAASGRGLSGIAVPETVNVHASGKMMIGIVEEVKGTDVRVHLTGIDETFDSSGDWWFPFSTAYSSSDGSGWYCMPEVKDEVRVFFPSGEEGEAFVASSVCSYAPVKTRDKSWKAPGGKEILLTDEGICIICKQGSIYIDMKDETGITIYADKNISIASEANIDITASNAVHVMADNEIIIGTETAYMALSKTEALLTAEEIRIE